MKQYIDKAAVVAEILRYKHKADERLKNKGRTLAEDLKDLALQNLCGNLIHFLDTLEVKEVVEVPANVMLNQFGNKYISSWSGLKEYDNFQINEEIKILIPNK